MAAAHDFCSWDNWRLQPKPDQTVVGFGCTFSPPTPTHTHTPTQARPAQAGLYSMSADSRERCLWDRWQGWEVVGAGWIVGNFFCGMDSFSADGFCIPQGVESARTACVTSDLMRSVFDFITASNRTPPPPFAPATDALLRAARKLPYGGKFLAKMASTQREWATDACGHSGPASSCVCVCQCVPACGECVVSVWPMCASSCRWLWQFNLDRCRLQSASGSALWAHSMCQWFWRWTANWTVIVNCWEGNQQKVEKASACQAQMKTVLPSVSYTDTLPAIRDCDLCLHLHLQQRFEHSLHSLCISSRIQLISFKCIRFRVGCVNTHTRIPTHTLTISQLDRHFHAFMQGQFQINLRSFEFWQKPKCKPSVIIQWGWAHSTVALQMATRGVTVCVCNAVEQSVNKYGMQREPGGVFCLSNNLCLLGHLGKTHLMAAQWAEKVN